MRLLVLLLAAVVSLAGCTATPGALQPADDPTDAPQEGPGAAPAPSPVPTASPPPVDPEEDEKTFCESQDGCKFWDDDYHEYALYRVDTLTLNVLLVPSASAQSPTDTQVMKAAADRWAEGIKLLGAPWFAENLTMRVYVLGQDTPPMDALQDPTIIIAAAEYNPVVLFGIGLEPKQALCSAIGQDTRYEYPVHAHHGMKIRAADCVGTGFLCIALNTNFLLGSDVYLQDLVAHELGHCLGGGHVGDALDYKAKRVPVQDIMSYQHDEENVHCVSNLNVRVLEALYAPLAGVEVEQTVDAGGYYTMPRAEYRHVECNAPTSE